MPTVTINGVDYDVYADTSTADLFLAGDFSATAWRAEADPDNKARALVTATRLIDRQQWIGDKTDIDQLHAFPRSGTGLADVDPDVVPQAIIDASIVIAKLIEEGATVDSQPADPNGNVRRQQAGSVSIEYFFSPENPSRLPLEVMELISAFVGSVTLPNALAYGTCGESIVRRGFTVGYDPA